MKKFNVGDIVSIPTDNPAYPYLRRKITRIHIVEDDQCIYWRRGKYEIEQSFIPAMWVYSDFRGKQIRLIKTKCPTNDMPDTRAYLEAVAHDR